MANVKSDSPDKRTFYEKFTLKSWEYERSDKTYKETFCLGGGNYEAAIECE